MLLKKIIVPVDFSAFSQYPLETAIHFAQLKQAEIVLLHVLEEPSLPLRLISSTDMEDMRDRAQKLMSQLTSKLGASEVEVSTMIKVGKPHKAIVEAAKEISPWAIFMSTHGASGIQEYLVGSNASRVIRAASCPVISFRNPHPRDSFRNILLPLDLTKETREKIAFAVEFSEYFGAKINVISVLQTTDVEIRNRLQQQLDKVEEFFMNKEIQVSARLLLSEAPISDVVVKYGEEIGADLLMIMTQQELKIKEHFMGSTAEHIVNHSNIPVISIRPMRDYQQPNLSWSFN
ncbi:MAG: universal stress protein [Sphingobacteriia bacterium]|nr:universal stress protein [Sphingobacteriia bacterium]